MNCGTGDTGILVCLLEPELPVVIHVYDFFIFY